MQKIYFDALSLDALARKNFSLSEELMMENAAVALEERIAKHLQKRGSGASLVLVLAGSGNNGADGYALARRVFSSSVDVCVCSVSSNPNSCGNMKTKIGVEQKSRAERIGVTTIALSQLKAFVKKNSSKIAAIVDCVFGASFRLPLPQYAREAIEFINDFALQKNASTEKILRLACDVPSGLDACGNGGAAFCADETVTMGALKLSLFSDNAKDFCGQIFVADLGIARERFESAETEFFLLEKSDAALPVRTKSNVNKGSFGHLAIVSGEKPGAAEIAGSAALSFGAGLVTLLGVSKEFKPRDKELMGSFLGSSGDFNFPEKTSAVALGMGLGRNFIADDVFACLNKNKIPSLIDADLFYNKNICPFLLERSKKNLATIITPHPKEFSALISNCNSFGLFDLENTSLDFVLQNKFDLAKKFAEAFPNVVLVLKGANVLIAQKSAGTLKIFVNPHGSPALAKAGSGDVLSGLAASLLAQGKSPLGAAVDASLVHSFSSRIVKNNFALTPKRLIKAIQDFE